MFLLGFADYRFGTDPFPFELSFLSALFVIMVLSGFRSSPFLVFSHASRHVEGSFFLCYSLGFG